MKKNIAFVALGLLIIVACLSAVKGSQILFLIKDSENQAPPSVSVSTFDVISDEWQSTLKAIGSLEAAKGLLITADLSGRIAKINFEAGDNVKAGDLIVGLDVSSELAQLRSSQASAELAKKNLERIRALFGKGVASKSEFDNAQTNYRSATASVDNIQAIIDKKNITAPFDGSLGIRLVNLGQTIQAGTPVVSLQARNQMFFNFHLPQQSLSKIKSGLTVNMMSDAIPGEVFTGVINAIDTEINENTRSVKVQAIIANPKGQLLSGMFATVEVVLAESIKANLVPVTSIQYATYGNSVFIVERQQESELSTNDLSTSQADNDLLTVTQKFVKLGETRGDFIHVLEGLEPGQTVVSAGAFKLRNGSQVTIGSFADKDYSLHPTSQNN